MKQKKYIGSQQLKKSISRSLSLQPHKSYANMRWIAVIPAEAEEATSKPFISLVRCISSYDRVRWTHTPKSNFTNGEDIHFFGKIFVLASIYIFVYMYMCICIYKYKCVSVCVSSVCCLYTICIGFERQFRFIGRELVLCFDCIRVEVLYYYSLRVKYGITEIYSREKKSEECRVFIRSHCLHLSVFSALHTHNTLHIMNPCIVYQYTL